MQAASVRSTAQNLERSDTRTSVALRSAPGVTPAVLHNLGTSCAKAETYESYGLDRASFNQGVNAQYGFSVLTEQQPTLVAKGPGAVCTVQRGEGLNG